MQLINVYINSGSVSHIHKRESSELLSGDPCVLCTSMAVRTRQISGFASTRDLAGIFREMKICSLRSKSSSPFPLWLLYKKFILPHETPKHFGFSLSSPHKYSIVHYPYGMWTGSSGLVLASPVGHSHSGNICLKGNEWKMINIPEGYQTYCKHLVQWKQTIKRKQWWEMKPERVFLSFCKMTFFLLLTNQKYLYFSFACRCWCVITFYQKGFLNRNTIMQLSVSKHHTAPLFWNIWGWSYPWLQSDRERDGV